MVIGVLQVELHLPESHSLKDKRSVIKSLKDRARGKFNVAIAEVESNETWQRATLGIAAVGSGRGYVDGLLEEVMRWIRKDPFVAVMQVEQERF